MAACLLIACVARRPALPQNSPDMQKVLDRLDKLEEENRKLVDEIHELRNELTGHPVTRLQIRRREQRPV